MRARSPFYDELASRLWVLLQERGLSERDLAERVDVQPRTVRRWLEGKSRILYASTIVDIIRAIGCRWEDLWPGRDHRWVVRLASHGLGPVEIGRHVGLHPEYVHLLLERHSLATLERSEGAMN